MHNEQTLLRLHANLWNPDTPNILINPKPSVIILPSTAKSAYWEISRHSSQGWAIANEHSDVKIYGTLSAKLYAIIPRPTDNCYYCLGSELYLGNNPDLLRLGEAMQESLVLLRSSELPEVTSAKA